MDPRAYFWEASKADRAAADGAAPDGGAQAEQAAPRQPTQYHEHYEQKVEQRGTPAPQQGVEAQPPPQLAVGQAGEAAAVVRHSCAILALPTRVASTALTFLHQVEPSELPPERLAAACLFLASKVEEASVRTNDMLNAVAAWKLVAASSGNGSGRTGGGGEGDALALATVGGGSVGDTAEAANCGGSREVAVVPGSAGVGGEAAPTAAGSGGGGEAAPTAAGDASGADGGVSTAAAATAAADAAIAAAVAAFPCIVGAQYAAAKRQLILDEQLLLRLLRFEIGADQPHRHLYVLAHVWGAQPGAVRVATCLLNDAVAHCAQYGTPVLPPATAAAAALHVGCQLAGGQGLTPVGWWRATGIADADMAAACSMLLDLIRLP